MLTFNEKSIDGHCECLMNSIKDKWQSPTVVHYRDDPYAFKFVKTWNTQFQRKPISRSLIKKK